MQVPAYYSSLQYSACGGVCAGFSREESKILIAKHNYLLREFEIEKREGEWEACFRIEKQYIRCALYNPGSEDKEVHVTVSLLNDCWEVHFDEDVIICTDTSTSDDGSVFVQQRPTKKGVRYTFNHDPKHTLDVECTDTVPNEPLFTLSAPAGKWMYAKLLNKVYVIKSRTLVATPFGGFLEWMDDDHGVACVETLTGFRELWRLTHRNTWELVKRINARLHVNGLPVR